MAADYDAKAALSDPSLSSMFYDKGRGAFSDGFVFRPSPRTMMKGERTYDLGHWSCDLACQDKLTWSDEVYELFGIEPRTPVDREWVVGRYKNGFRTTLERVRNYAIKHGLGFILDAEINPEGRRKLWMRIFAVPVADQHRRIIRLEGVKREL